MAVVAPPGASRSTRVAPSASLTTRQEVDGEDTSHATVLESETRVCTSLTLSCLWPHRHHFFAARSDCPHFVRAPCSLRGRQRKGRARTALFRRFWPIAACRVACRVLRSRHTRVKKRPRSCRPPTEQCRRANTSASKCALTARLSVTEANKHIV